ncbi:MAG: lipopolysaccharide heptosyltransferase II [Deltaproteobacteria bacterium]|nr:lipopolysaccharide heptosyltransferase II [Deltaproteobacteria bacterium]
MGEDTGIKKLLVRTPNWIGDAVMCLPAIDALKGLYPKAGISVLTKTRAFPVFENNPSIEEVIEYDDRGRHKGIAGRLRLAREIRGMGFDLAVLLQNAFDAAFIAYMAMIPERAGYSRDFRKKLLTIAIPVTEEIKKMHQVCYYLNIAGALGAKTPKEPQPMLYLLSGEVSWADEFLREKSLEGAVLIGASPGASYGPAKRWPAKYFSSVLQRLSKEYGAVPLIFGSKEDELCAKEVDAGLSGQSLNLAGRLTLRQFMSLLKRMRLFITNDSGPMHLSAALGAPTAAVFGSTDPGLTGPVGPFTKVIKAEGVDCSPCFERECRYKHYNCLNEIKPDDVYAACREIIAKGRNRV